MNTEDELRAATRQCRICGLGEPEVEFYASMKATCKGCQKDLMRAYYKTDGYKKKNSAQQKKRLQNPAERQRHAARGKLAAAIKKGWVKRPDKCSVCGARGKPHGHHENYSKPLTVIWVCIDCHAEIHSKDSAVA